MRTGIKITGNWTNPRAGPVIRQDPGFNLFIVLLFLLFNIGLGIFQKLLFTVFGAESKDLFLIVNGVFFAVIGHHSANGVLTQGIRGRNNRR